MSTLLKILWTIAGIIAIVKGITYAIHPNPASLTTFTVVMLYLCTGKFLFSLAIK